MNLRNYAAIALTAFFGLTANSLINAGELTSARSVAMGGALTALADGVDAAKFNPANLGLSGYQITSLELISVGINISNNSFTLSDYNNYTGATLSTADKNDIMNKIPKEGLNLRAGAEAAAMSLSLGKYVFSITAVGAADINLNKDILELVFYGNTFSDSISVDGSYSDGLAYVQAGFSYGHQVYQAGQREFSIGTTIKYISGLAVEEMVELNGVAITRMTGFDGQGRMVARTASGGTGYGIDIGAALRLNQHYTIGLRIENALSNISWNKNAEEHVYEFNLDTLTLSNSGNLVYSTDTTIPIASFSTRLPAVMNAGIANTSGKLRWAIDWQQGFNSAPGSSTKPRLSLGIEWLQLGMMPLRFGMSSGGNKGSSFSFGSGIDLSPVYLDFAAVTGTGFSMYSAKGLKLALSTGIRF